jgi:two-component system chemotaxis response regulator CheY
LKAKNEPLQVTISLGVTVASRLAPEDLEALLGAADAALYRAKEAGRNRVEFSPNPRPSSGTPD